MLHIFLKKTIKYYNKVVDLIKDGHFFQIMVDNIMLTCYTLNTKCNIFVTN